MPNYDPNIESDRSEKNAALHWELLRRNQTFQDIATRWASDRRFRFNHAGSDDYHHKQVHFHRCALDWMVPVRDRIELARHQVSQMRWFREDQFLFGPIRSDLKINPLDLRREDLPHAFDIRPMPGSHELLSTQQIWPKTPGLFRAQFINSLGGDFQLEVITDKVEQIGRFLLWAAARIHRGDTPENLPELVQQMAVISDKVRRTAQFHHVIAIPNARVPARILNGYLVEIRRHCTDRKMVENRYSGNSSWLGTETAWRWFLVAEERRLALNDESHLYQLASLYSTSLNDGQFDKERTTRKHARSHGFRGVDLKASVISNRRKTVKGFVQQIAEWRDDIYPPGRWISRIHGKTK